MKMVFESAFSTYRGVSQIGTGGAGTVWRAVDADGKDYAIKYLPPASITADRVKRFKNELAFCSRNEHKNILKVLDWGHVIVDGTKCPFYVMPLYANTLRDLLNRKISKDKVLRHFGQLLDGVEAAHMLRVWHRDLKPENVLHDVGSDTLVVADFGIAYFSEAELQTLVVTSPHARLANFQYAAPEQRIKGGKVDSRADIYALGLILNEMFTGVIAHGVGFKRIADVAPEFTYLDDVVDAMLHQTPEHRPETIRQLKAILIAHTNDFISQQKLNALKQTVIPETEIDDPLILDPPQLVGARWENGYLFMTLNKPVNPLWTICFKNPGSHTSIHGRGPGLFEVLGETLKINSDGGESQQLIDYTKDYVRMANENYKLRVQRDAHKKKHEDEQKLKQRLNLEQKQREINARLKV